MLKKEYELLMPFIKEPWKRFTFNQIKKLSGKRSKSYVYDGLKRYVKDEILQEEKAGNVILYCLNISEPKTQAYMGFIAEYVAWHKKYLPFTLLRKVSTKIPTPFHIFIITGSYVRNEQKKGSDVDIVIVCDDKQDTKYILAQIHQTCELSIPPGHPYVFKKSEFMEMLLNKEANYGKEISKNNLLLFGGQEYYRMMNEAIENGFNDKKLH